MAAEEMEDLARRYADQAVRSVFIYTREAHPAENYRHHKTMDDKRATARAFREHSSIQRQILLDTLEGDAHHAYGLLPNMTWIMTRGGFIFYKAAWTGVADVESALTDAIDFQANRREKGLVPFYSERATTSPRDQSQFMAGLERAGPQAVADFQRVVKARMANAKPPQPDDVPKIPGNFYKPED